tara:strand:+ start:529 stop:1173 length:645 start_codon:yes stop_codon:yes gene_type:complete
MADRVVYKGANHVLTNNTEGRIRLIQPKAGTINKFIRWWNRKGSQYIECGIFRVELENGVVVRLVIPHVKGGMTVEIRHDGYGNFTFPGCRLERIAVVAADSSEVLVEYQFSKVSGGAVLKRTLAGIPTPTIEVVVPKLPEVKVVDETPVEEPTEPVVEEAEEVKEEETTTEAQLKKMTKKQMLAWALERGHDFVDNHTKAELLAECIEILSAD